jgi:2-deoxy-D-gluconate 3-dehydrogenase
MSLNPFDLSGRVAIVTGANTGLGQGVATALAAAGADIVAVGRTPPVDTQQAVEALGRRFHPISADLSSMEPIGRIVAESVETFGGVDILVNNAGIIRRNDALDFTEEDWDAVMNVNLKTTFFLTQAVGRRMLEQGRGGKVINIASLLSFQGGIRVASYTASKSGIGGVTKLLANEWAAKGINVNAIAPGYFVTNNTEALRSDEGRSRDILARIPAGRWGSPEDLGGAAVFLASRASDYVHGTVLAVDGGWLGR